MSEDQRPPECFISYAWQGQRHEAWVAKLATSLAANGVVAHVDFWETHLGTDLAHYMETSIEKSDYILLICTPRYASRANGREGGVGYETAIVTGDMFAKASKKEKFVPLLRGGDGRSAIPTFLKGRKYLDVRDARGFSRHLEQILRHIFRQPRQQQPKLGPRPDFSKPLVPPVPITQFSSTRARVAGTRKKVTRQVERKERQLQRLQTTPVSPQREKASSRATSIVNKANELALLGGARQRGDKSLPAKKPKRPALSHGRRR